MHSQLMDLLRAYWNIAINCLQWGDTGKGKFVDLITYWADVIVRGRGGANAGHSVLLGDEEYVFHLIPSSILHDIDGKVSIIGNGVAVDPRILCDELALLKAKNQSYNNFMLALNAKLTLPTQIVRDRIVDKAGGKVVIGTTGRGIGPTYSDHALRIGLEINDLLNPDILAKNVRNNVTYSLKVLQGYDPEIIKDVMHHEHLSRGLYYHPKKIFDVDSIITRYLQFGEELAEFIQDTDSFVQAAVGRRKILLEGSQGALLDVDNGTRPYVTGTSTIVDGLAIGAGFNLHKHHVDLALGVVKFPYMTRVGSGPFPTEFGDRMSEEWCRDATQEKDLEQFATASTNDINEFSQGGAIRRLGREFGATTRRPRRTGWLDLPLLRYAMRWGSENVILTKPDVLDTCEQIKICTSYIYDGPDYRVGTRVLTKGTSLREATPMACVLEHCKPVYEILPGWQRSIRGIRHFQDLPPQLISVLNFVGAEAGIKPKMISVGPAAEETIIV